jgi:hypothetical protein
MVKIKSPLPPMLWRLYNPYVGYYLHVFIVQLMAIYWLQDAPEFLVGCSSSLIVYAAHGFKSKPALVHQRSTTFRKLSLPSRRPSSKRKYHGTPPGRLQSALPTLPPSIPSQGPPSKPFAFKSLLQRSRPRSRSDIHREVPFTLHASPVLVSQGRRVQDRSAHFPKLRFTWLKI